MLLAYQSNFLANVILVHSAEWMHLNVRHAYLTAIGSAIRCSTPFRCGIFGQCMVVKLPCSVHIWKFIEIVNSEASCVCFRLRPHILYQKLSNGFMPGVVP